MPLWQGASVAEGDLTHVNLARGYRGGERQTELLVRGLAGLGFRQRLVARRGGALAERVADVPGLDLRTAGFGTIGAAAGLRGAGLVHVHEGRGIQAASLMHGLASTPYLVTRRSQQGPQLTAFNRHAYGAAAVLVALSQAVSTALHRLDPQLDVRIIPSAGSGLTAAPGARQSIRAALGAGPDAFVVGHVGALVDSDKGQSQIIALAHRWRSRRPDVHFVLVGSGRDEAWFRDLAAGCASVHFAGETRQVGDYLAAFDLFLFPSRFEGLGSVLIDALEFGLPVVAARVGGIPEIIVDGENGSLCEPGNLDALERAVLTLLDDPTRRAEVAAANRRRAGDFSAAAMTGRYVALYRELASAGRCRLALPAGDGR